MGSTDKSPSNIFTFKDEKSPPDPFQTYSNSLRDSGVPIVIDNGSYQCRAGWASSPKPELIFKNITAKQRGRKDLDVQVGNDITNIEVVRWMLRTPFDRNLVTLYEVQEQIFDHVFNHLGINTEGGINHPVVLTEPPCNPNYCRHQMSELLFECYHVPQVAYGVDSLFSFYANHPSPEKASGLIVDCGYQTVHILPVLYGRIDPAHCRRLNIGGAHADWFMQRLLQLKCPGHLNSLSISRCEELVRDHTYMAVDYKDELESWVDPDYYEKHVHKIQLPFSSSISSQLSAEQQKERREQQIRRLKEACTKRRQEKLAKDEEMLQRLLSAQELLDDEDEVAFNKILEETDLESQEELQAEISKLTISIQRAKEKLLGIESTPIESEKKQFEFLNIPDDQLTPEQLEIKKRQRILALAREGRIRAQALQKEKRQKELEEEKKLEQLRMKDFATWLKEVRQRRQQLMEKRNSRKQRKADMAKRKTYAAQQRMRIITQLAQVSSSKKGDTFGMNDSDWEVYKEINPECGDSDSDVEEEKLEELETMLKEHDPEFQKELDDAAGPVTEFDIAEYYRVHLAVERIRVPELLFQPSMIGVEQAGIAETIDFVLKKYPMKQQNKLSQYVFLTGGNASFPHFKDRLDTELLSLRPFQSKFSVSTAANPSMDAWNGAKKFALSSSLPIYSVTRSEYEEKGGEYLKEHCSSNRYFPTPVVEAPVVKIVEK